MNPRTTSILTAAVGLGYAALGATGYPILVWVYSAILAAAFVATWTRTMPMAHRPTALAITMGATVSLTAVLVSPSVPTNSGAPIMVITASIVVLFPAVLMVPAIRQGAVNFLRNTSTAVIVLTGIAGWASAITAMVHVIPAAGVGAAVAASTSLLLSEPVKTTAVSVILAAGVGTMLGVATQAPWPALLVAPAGAALVATLLTTRTTLTPAAVPLALGAIGGCGVIAHLFSMVPA